MHKEVISHVSRHRTLEGMSNLTPVTKLDDIKDGVVLCHVPQFNDGVDFITINTHSKTSDAVVPITGNYHSIFQLSASGETYSTYFATFSSTKKSLPFKYQEITSKDVKEGNFYLINQPKH